MSARKPAGPRRHLSRGSFKAERRRPIGTHGAAAVESADALFRAMVCIGYHGQTAGREQIDGLLPENGVVSATLERRCALLLLAAMGMAVLVGLLAWGPVALQADEFRYADTRRWWGIPNAMNVLANLPVMLAGALGLHRTRTSVWPAHVRMAWQGFHGAVVLSGAAATAHHLAPTVALFVLSQMAMATALTLLCCGALAERVDVRFGSPRGLAVAGLFVSALALQLAVGTWLTGSVDLRPVLLLQLLPVLLIPTGAMSLPGSVTRLSDWMLMLTAYGLARAFEQADVAIFSATGWIGGHALMHLSLACAAGWLTYRAGSASTCQPGGEGAIQRQTSLNTAA